MYYKVGLDYSMWPQILAASLASMSTLLAGTVYGWPAIATPHLLAANNITEDETSLMNSIAALSAMVTGLPAGYIANHFGRKTVLLSLSVPYFLGYLLIMCAGSNMTLLYIARVILGACLGLDSVVSSLYNEEVVNVDIRGTMGVYLNLSVILGVVWTYVVGGFFGYRVLNLTCLALPVVFAATFCFMPESPIYLIGQGRKTEAEASLRWLRRGKQIPAANNNNDNDKTAQLKHVQEEMMLLEDILDECGGKDLIDPGGRKRSPSRIQDVLDKVSWRTTTGKSFIIVLSMMILQQASAMEVVCAYAVQIFEDTGSSISPYLSTAVTGVVQIPATVASAMLVERCGRRRLVVVPTLVMGACLLLFSGYLHVKKSGAADLFDWLPLVLISTYVVAESMGIGCLPWLMMTELIPTQDKGWMTGVMVTANGVTEFLMLQFFPSLVRRFGSEITFAAFSAMCVGGACLMYLIVPETRGKTLLQIQRELRTW